MDYEVKMEDLSEDLKAIAKFIGLDTLLEFLADRGGEAIYFPKLIRVVRQARDRRIVEEFNGSNYRELAKEYGLTVASIRQIIKTHRQD